MRPASLISDYWKCLLKFSVNYVFLIGCNYGSNYITNVKAHFQLGKPKVLELEYEFEDIVSEEKVKEENNASEVDVKEEVTEGGNSISDSTSVQSSTTSTATIPPQILSPTSHGSISVNASHSSCSSKVDNTKDLSGMLSSLMKISQQLFQNKSLVVDSSNTCICGAIPGKSVRSPRGGGSVGTGSNSLRSPRGSISALAKSPGVGRMGVSIVPDKRTKPASAKRLIAPEEDGSAQVLAY